MKKTDKFTCVIIGEGTLPIKCAEILIQKNCEICGIISTDPFLNQWAKKQGITCLETIEEFKAQNDIQSFDYLFSIVNKYLLPPEVIALPNQRAINYHDSLLPKYAGTHATSWALLNHETTHGVTWHTMNHLVDGGDILKQTLIDIDANETTFTLNTKCYEAAIHSFSDLIDDLARDQAFSRNQNLVERTFFSQYKRPKGGCVISWNNSAYNIVAFVRALNFGPYTNTLALPKLYLDSQFILITEMEVLSTTSSSIPGTITAIEKEFLQVATETQDVKLCKLLTSNGHFLSISDFVVQFALYIGYQFHDINKELATLLTINDKLLAENEQYWVTRLGYARPVTLQTWEQIYPSKNSEFRCTEILSPTEVHAFLKNHRPEWKMTDVLLTAFVLFVALHEDMNCFDIGFRLDTTYQGITDLEDILAQYVPLHINLDFTWTFAHAYEVIHDEIKFTREHRTYAHDVWARYPSLKSSMAFQKMYPCPVNIEIVTQSQNQYFLTKTDNLPSNSMAFVVVDEIAKCYLIYNSVFTGNAEDNCPPHVSQFKNLLQNVVTHSEQPLSQLSLLTQSEKHLAIVGWNNTEFDYPQEKCFNQCFEAQVELTPDAVAVRYGNQQLSYQQLNQQANKLADFLINLGIGSDDLIAVLTERNIDFLIAMIGIFKAGGAYLPLDNRDPSHRISKILTQSGVRFVLVADKYLPVLGKAVDDISESERPQFLSIDKPLQQQRLTKNLPQRGVPHNLAYVIYTSGSTGMPKGAMVEHQGMLNHLYAKVSDLNLTSKDVIAETASQCFDISVWQFLAALLVGGQVCIFNDEIAYNPLQLLKHIKHYQISILETVPSLLREALKAVSEHDLPDLSCLRWLIPTGEALPPKLSRQWFSYYPNIPLLNAYGPTECSDDVTHYIIKSPPAEEVMSIPVGFPIANTQLYILDSRLQIKPIGSVGELYVGGIGVGRGYLNNPKLTAQKFIPDPFSQQPGVRLYQTGDLARYLPNGCIEFLGRIDHQVKVRGFRIELGEVESSLEEHPLVRAAVVIEREDASLNKQLVAYIIPVNQDLVSDQLRQFLRAKLPEYMIPQTFVTLEAFPLTPNGKVDRKALPSPDAQLPEAKRAFISPQTYLEKNLAIIWSEMLNIEQIGREDNFFALGGHSLLAIRIVSKIQETLDAKLQLHDIFENPTISELACRIEGLNQKIETRVLKKTRSEFDHKQPMKPDNVIKDVDENAYPVTYFQKKYVRFFQNDPASCAGIIVHPMLIKGSLNVDKFKISINKMVESYPILRTIIESIDNRIYQRPIQNYNLKIAVINYNDDKSFSQGIETTISQEANTPFNLYTDILVRVNILTFGIDMYCVVLTFHHLIIDKQSLSCFLKQLFVLYTNTSAVLENAVSFSDFARAQFELTKHQNSAAFTFWIEQVRLAQRRSEKFALPWLEGEAEEQEFDLTTDLSQAIIDFCQANNLTPTMWFLSVFSLFLQSITNQVSVSIGVTMSMRQSTKDDLVIGPLVNHGIFTTNGFETQSFVGLCQEIKVTMLNYYKYIEFPVEYFRGKTDEGPLTSLFDFLMNYYERSDEDDLYVDDLKIKNLRINPSNATMIRSFTLNVYALNNNQFRCQFRYRKALFDLVFTTQFQDTMLAIIKNILTFPDHLLLQIIPIAKIREM